MDFLRKLFGKPSSEKNEEKQEVVPTTYKKEELIYIDERFVYNFKMNGGKFLYCENLDEVRYQLENILAENDWFEREALCLENKYFILLEENKIPFQNPKKPVFSLIGCENLIANEGSILFSSTQIKHFKTNELPINMIVIATTSQIIETQSDGLSAIKTKYKKELPTNITSFKHFENVDADNFIHYGSVAKNCYLLLLEDQ